MKIVLVEDEKRMAQALCQILRLEIMRLITALMGFPVWKPLKQTYMISLFWMLCCLE